MKGLLLVGAAGTLALLTRARISEKSARAIIQELNTKPFEENEILGVIQTESSFRPFAISTALAFGLMQVQYPTAKDMGFNGLPTGLFTPDTNIKYGVKYLQWLYNQFGSKEAAYHAYNMGPGNYKQGRRNPAYVQKIKYYASGFV